MFCVQCGKELDNNQEFCGNCGNRISNGTDMTAETDTTARTDMTTGHVEKIENKKQKGQGMASKIILIILAALFLLSSFFWVSYDYSGFQAYTIIYYIVSFTNNLEYFDNVLLQGQWFFNTFTTFVVGICLLVAVIVGLNKTFGKILTLIFSCLYGMLNILWLVGSIYTSIEYNMSIFTKYTFVYTIGVLGYLFVTVVILIYIINPATSKALGILACITLVVCELAYIIALQIDILFFGYYYYDISLMIQTVLLVGMATITMICLAKKRSLNNHI